MKPQAKKAPEFLKKAVLYQIFPRPFTQEGTLKAAEKMLPHLAETGIDVAYLTPIVLSDDDMDEAFWSPRQRASKMGNPKNPYRMKDYFQIDPEYGTEEDLRSFVGTAHKLGMRVILDLVYYHCGPKAVLIEKYPDFVKRNEDGSVKNGDWLFPMLNFDNPELREYLWKNMEYFIREFDVDGYRCDVSGAVPVDFWEEGRRRIEALKPDVIMLAESSAENEQIAAFDFNYKFSQEFAIQDIFLKNKPASSLRNVWIEMRDKFPEGARFINCFENHDMVSDNGEGRMERAKGPAAVEAAMILIFTLDDIPMLYNGQEIADDSVQNLWANRFYGKTYYIKWENALTPVGKNRFDFVRDMISMRRTFSAFTEGNVRWLNHDFVIAYIREKEDERILVIVNPSEKPVSAEINLGISRLSLRKDLAIRNSDVSFQDGKVFAELEGYGFAVVRI